jgi:hypothetical protein
MMLYLSTNTILGEGWYVDGGAYKHMDYDKNIFSRFQEQEGGLCVELGDDSTYLVKVLVLKCFQMYSSDVLYLDSILYVHELMKSLFSFSCMLYSQCLTKFDGRQITIRDNNHGFGKILAK